MARKNRGFKDGHLVEYDADHYLVKEEITHYGAKKVIIKNKKQVKSAKKYWNEIMIL